MAVRILRLVPVMVIVATATFFLLQLVPGDPALTIVGPEATPDEYEAVRQQLGLDLPLFERYLDWVGSLFRGDLGHSLFPPGQSVVDMVQARLPVTLELALLATLMALLLSIPAALYSAYRAGGRFDRVVSTVSFGFISLPSFVAALLLVFLFVFNPDLVRYVAVPALVLGAAWLAGRAVKTSRDYPPGSHRTRALAIGMGAAVVVLLVALVLWTSWPSFPRQGFVRIGEGIGTNLKSAFLPALTLAITEAAIFMRLLRADLMATLQEDFVLSAKAKGMPPSQILVRDALRPSSFSLITVAGVALGRLMGGTVIVETIFNLPGMGSMLVQAILSHDYPVVLGGVLVLAFIYVLLNAFVDISYAYLDPRVRRGRV